MRPELEVFVRRLRAAVTEGSSLEYVPEWLVRNTMSPDNPNRRWSFLGHEYQIEILKSTAAEGVCRKCSQVGASEMFLRLALAILAIWQQRTLIYTMPTAASGIDLAKTRIDPIIEGSDALRSMVDKNVDSTTLKKIGRSYLYVKGTMGQKAAISVPAKALFQDEVDFSDEDVLRTYVSRLGHNKEGEYLLRRFSTPTVRGYGIDAGFSASTQGYYTVHCGHCQDFVAPKFMDDVEIPGFEGTMIDLDRADLSNSEVMVDEAFCRCPVCRNPLHWQDFLNPEKRMWLYAYPTRVVQGWQVQPWDVPTINPIARTLRQLGDYRNKRDWVNFKVGDTYEDADTTFNLEALRSNSRGSPVRPPDGYKQTEVVKTMDGLLIGVDVGKNASYLLVGVPDKLGYEVVWAERIRQDGENYLTHRVNFISSCFSVSKGVVDHGPDFSFAKMFVHAGPGGRHWACYYGRSTGKSTDTLKLNEDEQVLTAHRTARFDQLVKRVNSGEVRFRNFSDIEMVHEHLLNLKKVGQGDVSDAEFAWVSVGEDHYGHALNYLDMAYDLMLESSRNKGAGDDSIPILPGLRKVKVGSSHEDMLARDPYDGFYSRHR